MENISLARFFFYFVRLIDKQIIDSTLLNHSNQKMIKLPIALLCSASVLVGAKHYLGDNEFKLPDPLV